MLLFINKCSESRISWFLIALSVFVIEFIALWFQHVLLVKPCVMCIYERCALIGILISGLLGTISSSGFLRFVAIAIWIYSALQGVKLSWEHTMIQLYPSPFAVCDFSAHFPQWFPLDRWLPQIFVATGDCYENQWKIMSLGVPQWLIGIFFVYSIVPLLILLAQFKGTEK